MIKIEIVNKGYLDLANNTSLSIEKLSDNFRGGVSKMGYSYPISIPKNHHNESLLGFIGELDSQTQFEESYPCRIYMEGVIFASGSLNISSINNKVINIFILEYEYDVKRLETRLRDIDYGGDRTIIPYWSSMREHANDSVNGNVDEGWDYVFFPIWNEGFYGNRTPNPEYNSAHFYSNVVNLWDFKAQSFWRNPVNNELFYVPPWGGTSSYPIPEYGTNMPPCASTFVPFPYLVYVIRRVAAHLGLNIVSNWLSQEDIKRLVIYNTYSLDKVETLPGLQYVPEYNLNNCNSTINVANHLPDITIAELLDALRVFNLVIKIEGNKLFIDPFPAPNAGLYQELQNEEVSTSYEITPPSQKKKGVNFMLGGDDSDSMYEELDKFKITERVKDDADTFLSSDPDGSIRFSPTSYIGKVKPVKFTNLPSARHLVLGDAEEEIEFSLGTLDTRKNLGIHYRTDIGDDVPGNNLPILYLTGIIPIANQMGTSKVYNTSGDFSLRLLFYAGMHPDPNGNGMYPFGTSNIYDDNGNPVLQNSLKWRGGDFAIYDKYWKGTAHILSGKIVKLPLRLSLDRFQSVDLNRPFKIGNRAYYITSLTVPISNKGIGLCTAKCIQIPL